MAVLEMLLPHAVGFALTLARIAGLFLFAPVLGSPIIPVQIKALLALGLTLAVYPTLGPVETAVPLTTLTAAPLIAVEVLFGLVIGLIASLPIISVQMGGLIAGQQMGLGIASFYNPAIDTEGDIAGQLLFFMAVAIFLGLGGMEAMHGAVVRSFELTPAGGLAWEMAPVELLAGMVTAGFELAIRVAAPVLCVIFLETVAVGMIMKTVPQMNILSFGFPVRILAGVSAMYASAAAIADATTGDVQRTMRETRAWVESLGEAG